VINIFEIIFFLFIRENKKIDEQQEKNDVIFSFLFFVSLADDVISS
jgi:hypothetical protein